MSDVRSAVSPCGHIAEPLQVIRLSIDSADAARRQYPGYRLTRLVGARLELDEKDIERLCDMLGLDLLRPVVGASRPFDYHLRHVIALYELGALFSDEGHAPYHHAIRPTGYDYHRDAVDPHGMELWRADYRAMPDVRQMMAASILWLYRAGKDNVWLRRVPCTWHAAEAIACLRANGAFEDCARLYALYPGW
ncbi:hypothetical protein [Ensifer adhaerens]|uniref:hypothetical protein n=1 Tax=Ensifer adhaerens TaxID=106592 RepID=UPI0008074F92|nr:hypothetical protein [Ensifer adhaerens]